MQDNSYYSTFFDTVETQSFNSLLSPNNNNSNNFILDNNDNNNNTNNTPSNDNYENSDIQINTLIQMIESNISNNNQNNTTHNDNSTYNDNNNNNNDNNPPNKNKRRKRKDACIVCHNSKVSCSGDIPCNRCKRLDKVNQCVLYANIKYISNNSNQSELNNNNSSGSLPVFPLDPESELGRIQFSFYLLCRHREKAYPRQKILLRSTVNPDIVHHFLANQVDLMTLEDIYQALLLWEFVPPSNIISLNPSAFKTQSDLSLQLWTPPTSVLPRLYPSYQLCWDLSPLTPMEDSLFNSFPTVIIGQPILMSLYDYNLQNKIKNKSNQDNNTISNNDTNNNNNTMKNSNDTQSDENYSKDNDDQNSHNSNVSSIPNFEIDAQSNCYRSNMIVHVNRSFETYFGVTQQQIRFMFMRSGSVALHQFIKAENIKCLYSTNSWKSSEFRTEIMTKTKSNVFSSAILNIKVLQPYSPIFSSGHVYTFIPVER